MSLRSKFFKWLTHGQLQVNPVEPKTQSPYLIAGSLSSSPQYAADITSEQPSIALKFIKAANGQVVEVTTFFKTKHGHIERDVETYVVAQGDKLSDTILQILAIKALEK